MPKQITEHDILAELAAMEIPNAIDGEYSLPQVCERFGWSRDQARARLGNLVKSGKATSRRAVVQCGRCRAALTVYRLAKTS